MLKLKKVKMFINDICEINEFIKDKKGVQIDSLYKDTPIVLIYWDYGSIPGRGDYEEKSCLLKKCTMNNSLVDSKIFINTFNEFVKDKYIKIIEIVPGLECLFVKWGVIDTKVVI